MPDNTSLLEQAQREADALASQAGDGKSHVGATVNQTGVAAEAEIEMPKGWSASAWAKYCWDKTWAAAGSITKSW